MDITEKRVNNLTDALPQEVFELLNSTERISEIFPVNNGERFAQQILKADEIIFQPMATLTFTNTDVPFLVAYAKRWKIKDNSFPLVIELDRSVRGFDGADGTKGASGANGVGETDRHGHNGNAGGAGTDGGNGEAKTNPTVYLIMDELVCINEDQDVNDSKLVLDFDGIAGGDGGDGGEGGNGGNGASGKRGAMGFLECKEGAGRGGNGGSSGSGGAGGNGGNGSNGSDIYIITTESVAESFVNIAKFDIKGGFGGRGGRAGRAGKPGRAGRGGSSNGLCGRGSDGNDGGYPNPESLADGSDGVDGEKGKVYKVIVNDVA